MMSEGMPRRGATATAAAPAVPGAAFGDAAETPGWTGVVMAVLRFVTQLVGINLLALAGTLAGGVVLGLGPAIASARGLTAQLNAGAPSQAVWREFWAGWRADFRRANLLAAPFWGAAVLLLVDFGAAQAATGTVRAVMLVGLAVVGGYLLVALTYLPVITREFGDPWWPSLRFTLLAPALFPVRGVAILVVWVAVAVAYYVFPPVAILFGVALPLLLTGWLTASALAPSPAESGPETAA